MAQYPLGGVTWDYLHYVLGLSKLGHDVYYFEDTGQWPYNPVQGGISEDCSFNVKFLSSVMSSYGLSERWAYCFPHHSRWCGLDDKKREEIVQSSDLLMNVSGTLSHPDKYRQVRRMAYIDTDPVFTQIKLARGQKDFRAIVDMHDIHFSFGECLADAVPATGHRWHPTRQPVVLSEWHMQKSYRDVFTTVMNWTSYKPVIFNDTSYGQKDIEFNKFINLPTLIPDSTFEVAVNAGKIRRTPYGLLKQKGWHVVDPLNVCSDFESYRRYIESSKAEWSVAKNGYVTGQPGWFSCRSACYLAAGKPVVVQDTGFSSVLPADEGILAFKTKDDAIGAIKEVNRKYTYHASAARAIAKEYFDSDKVLRKLIDTVFATNGQQNEVRK
jgi:hypothetical protein